MAGTAHLSVVETLREQPPAPPEEDLFSRITILGEGRGDLVEALVPVDLINREEVQVNQAHVEELVTSMEAEAKDKNTSGQLSPVLIAAIPGESTFRIVDGFHRDAAIHARGEEMVFATIRPNSTYEEVVDLRILTANTHTAVTFARVIEWINDAWDRHPLADRITATQAFGLTTVNTNGKILGLSTEEAAGVKAWVQDKCEKWRMQPGSIGKNLKTASLADPELVKQARQRPGGRKLTEITPLHLGVIAQELPHKFEAQNLVSKIAIANNFNVQHTRALALLIKDASTIEEAEAIIASTDLSRLKAVHGKSRTRELRQQAAANPVDSTPTPDVPSKAATERAAALHKDYLVAELALGKATVENLVLRGVYKACLLHEREDPKFVVSDPRHKINQLLAAPPIREQVKDFRATVEAIEDKMIGFLVARKISAGKAQSLIAQASEMVVADIEHGPLGFIDLSRSGIFEHLLIASINTLVRSREQGEVKAHEVTAHVPKVKKAAVLDIFPDLRPRERKMLVLHGFMRAHPFALQQIIGVDAQTSTKGLVVIGDKVTSRHYALAGIDLDEAE